MPKINPGNRLYLYQLLSRELGVGRQTLLPRAEEALVADGLCVEDLGCSSMRELCEELGEFIKLTVFKKGYVYATVLANEEYDRALEQLGRGTEKRSGGKPWKRRGAKALRPVKPRHAERAAESEPEPEPVPVPEPEPEPVPEPEPEPFAESEPEPVESPEPQANSDPEPVAEPDPEPTIEVEPEPEPEPRPSISLTITYVPEQASERPHGDKAASDLPQDFHRDVRCPDDLLSRLYQVLPPDVDPVTTLEEDFRVARSTGTLGGTRSNVTYPLRYLRAGGTDPVAVTLRRSARTVAGKRWAIVAVDAGRDDEVGLEGLDEADRGPWSAFIRHGESFDPERSFAQVVSIGSWGEALERLARLAAPENWGEGHRVLRGYLTMTFARVRAEGKLVVSDDGASADFDTGLLTPDALPIYANLSGTSGDIPWSLDGFSTVGRALPARYASTLAEATFDPGLPAPELDRREALLRNPRLATSAYDPVSDKVRLLVPEGEGALALSVTEHGYEVVTSLSREDAYVCARVVSSEQPSWLIG